MAAHGSAFPIAKLALNNSVPPILMASLRMGLVLIILIPFWRFRIPDKKYFLPLVAFSLSMGVFVYVFMNLSLYHSSICLLYTSPSPRDVEESRMPSSA